MSSPLLSLRSVKLPRGFAGELNVDFAAGVHLVVGPNGVGKTSLLNCIAGTLATASGTISLDGASLTPGSSRVVLAPNTPPDIPWIRAGLLLEFIVSLYPATAQGAEAAATVVERLGITPFMNAPLGTLSAGTARKLLLAAALIAAPPVLLFDEPTNDIDAPSSAAFVAMMGAAAAQRVVLVTTHHTADLKELAPGLLDLAARR